MAPIMIRISLCASIALLLGACSMPFGLQEVFVPASEQIDAGAETIRFWVGSDDDFQGQGQVVGCGSYLLPVDTGIERGTDIERDLQQALEALFDPEQDHPVVETFDWIKQLALGIESVRFREGAVQIHLAGALLGIGSCGDAILEAQFLQTIFQFDHIHYAFVSDGVTNLRQIVEMSDRLTREQLQHYVYHRP